MLARVHSITTVGLQPLSIEVEVDAGVGEPRVYIVGLPNKAVQESQQRVMTALQNCGIRFPAKRLIINLAPADIPKEGPNFDLPIAMGILHAIGTIEIPPKTKIAFLGELSLDGGIRKVKGVLPAVLHARKKKLDYIVIPYENRKEVEIISGITIHPIKNIMEVIEHFMTKTKLPVLEIQSFTNEDHTEHLLQMDDIHGQETAKRALIIASAGGHNVLLNGSPGSGKSMLAKAMVSILPPLTEHEAIEVTNIYSVTGLTATGLIRKRPFRSPHHTTSQVGLIGGGSKLKPGEISLAHRGILFLDEFPEFSSASLESLRQPLEDHVVQISRASGSVKYPAQFTLIAAANPCPCGQKLSKTKQCICSQFQIEKYQKKLSGPILDRIDLHIHVQEVEVSKLAQFQSATKNTTQDIRELVLKARERQRIRFENTNYTVNSELSSQSIKKFCTLHPDAHALLTQAAQKLGLSARSYFKMIKVAQTIADIEGAKEIGVPHIAEALQYRPVA